MVLDVVVPSASPHSSSLCHLPDTLMCPMKQATDPRKWILGAVALVLVGVVATVGYLSSYSHAASEKTYTVAPHYVARNYVDLSRMPDSSFLQITENDHVRVTRSQGD